MKLLVLIFIGFTAAARLDNTYLPPPGAKNSGGNGELLKTPSLQDISRNSDSTGSIKLRENENNRSQFHENSSPNKGNLNGFQQSQAFSRQLGVTKALVNSGVQSENPNLSRELSPIENGHILSNENPQAVKKIPFNSFQNGVSNVKISNNDSRANILRFNNQNNADGSYTFEYETENDISHEETGQLKNLGDDEVIVVQGSYSYIGDDGRTYSVNYIADENGFQPIGEHIHGAIQLAVSESSKNSGKNFGGYPSGKSDPIGYQNRQNNVQNGQDQQRNGQNEYSLVPQNLNQTNIQNEQQNNIQNGYPRIVPQNHQNGQGYEAGGELQKQNGQRNNNQNGQGEQRRNGQSGYSRIVPQDLQNGERDETSREFHTNIRNEQQNNIQNGYPRIVPQNHQNRQGYEAGGELQIDIKNGNNIQNEQDEQRRNGQSGYPRIVPQDLQNGQREEAGKEFQSNIKDRQQNDIQNGHDGQQMNSQNGYPRIVPQNLQNGQTAEVGKKFQANIQNEQQNGQSFSQLNRYKGPSERLDNRNRLQHSLPQQNGGQNGKSFQNGDINGNNGHFSFISQQSSQNGQTQAVNEQTGYIY